MPALDAPTLDRLRAQLDAREAELREEVRTVREDLGGDVDSREPRERIEDSGERSEELIRESVRHAEMEADLDEAVEIDAARQRMADGSYGECELCGCDIPLARLQVQPAARRCAPCQEQWERTHPVGARIPRVP